MKKKASARHTLGNVRPTMVAPPAVPDPVLCRLAASLAHNVNNSLTGVIGYLELALNQVPPDSEVAGHLHNSLTCAFRAADAVREIVTFAARPPTAGAIAVLSLREIASRVLAHCQQSLPASVTAEVTGESPGWTQGNVALLENTLHHLLTNAVEAMPAGGVLTLHVHDEGDLCCLSVQQATPGPGVGGREVIASTCSSRS